MKSPKYKIFTNSKNTVFAVSTFAGKEVKAKAKCDPRDEFNYEKGKALAEARCGEKIATKRMQRAIKELRKAELAVKAAEKRVEKMTEYYNDSAEALVKAAEKVQNIFASFDL